MSIRLRLTLWYSSLLAITLLAFGIALFLYVNHMTYNDMKSRLMQEANRLEIEGTRINLFQIDLHPRITNRDLIIQLVNYTNGDVKRSNQLIEEQITFPYPGPAGDVTPGFTEIRVSGLNYPFILYQHPIVADNIVIGLLQVASYTESEARFLENFRNTLVLSSLAVVLLAFTIGLFLARKSLQPIENVIRAASQIDSGSNLSVRIPYEGPAGDELGRLTGTLNGMLERLEKAYNELDEAYKAQRRFVSDASHELRTPLTTIRGNIDLLEKMWRPRLGSGDGQATRDLVVDHDQAQMSMEAMQDISEEARRMTRLVGDMLSLARADAGYMMQKTDVQLLPIVQEVARRAHLLPRRAEFCVGDLSALSGAVIRGSADYLRQLLFIFIENAFKYTEQGEVELRAIAVSGQAGLIVRDTGIGMDAEEVPHIFERFYRADVSRGKTAGTGLGLSIAKWIIDEHGGSIEVKTRQGEGTTFVIWLPVAFSSQTDSGIMDEEGEERS
ncbi:HAMP domain-containing histidine kinase [Paenibacillus sp. IB182496]|uniref:histidine kinase n=1 Tax=Paenibacillus sabuli TaxID=2772509 RepID=A0A927GRK8_9BACL|nr:HAMP domain-containing sensor histidine kinase [Paenibacillus sabuli]MBD2845759.1 HAMP domain-containing histidine kinase [Paenibacillus sabuli]